MIARGRFPPGFASRTAVRADTGAQTVIALALAGAVSPPRRSNGCGMN
jgi:hypothetical protein